MSSRSRAVREVGSSPRRNRNGRRREWKINARNPRV